MILGMSTVPTVIATLPMMSRISRIAASYSSTLVTAVSAHHHGVISHAGGQILFISAVVRLAKPPIPA